MGSWSQWLASDYNRPRLRKSARCALTPTFAATDSGEYTPDVDVDHAIHLLQRRLLKRFRNGRARIVHQHIKPTEGCHRFIDRSFNGFGISGVRLNGDCLSTGMFNLLDD